jgi:hypothetical protein
MPYQLPHSEAKPPTLDPSRVPEQVRPFIDLAEKYGISDDAYRAHVIVGLDDAERQELVDCLSHAPKALGDWLAGPESYVSPPSNEYVAFTCLTMSADHAAVIQRRLIRNNATKAV